MMKSVGMAEEKLNVLYTIDDKEFPSMDYINVLEKWKGYRTPRPYLESMM